MNSNNSQEAVILHQDGSYVPLSELQRQHRAMNYAVAGCSILGTAVLFLAVLLAVAVNGSFSRSEQIAALLTERNELLAENQKQALTLATKEGELVGMRSVLDDQLEQTRTALARSEEKREQVETALTKAERDLKEVVTSHRELAGLHRAVEKRLDDVQIELRRTEQELAERAKERTLASAQVKKALAAVAPVLEEPYTASQRSEAERAIATRDKSAYLRLFGSDTLAKAAGEQAVTVSNRECREKLRQHGISSKYVYLYWEAQVLRQDWRAGKPAWETSSSNNSSSPVAMERAEDTARRHCIQGEFSAPQKLVDTFSTAQL